MTKAEREKRNAKKAKILKSLLIANPRRDFSSKLSSRVEAVLLSDPAVAACFLWRQLGRSGLSVVALAGILGKLDNIPQLMRSLRANKYLERFYCGGTRLPLFRPSFRREWFWDETYYVRPKIRPSRQVLMEEGTLLEKVASIGPITDELARKWGYFAVIRKPTWAKLKAVAALVAEK